LLTILWLAFGIRGLVAVVMFFIVWGFLSTICFGAGIVFAVGFGAFVIIVVVTNAVIVGAFFGGWSVIVGFIVVAVGGEHRLLFILWLAGCSY